MSLGENSQEKKQELQQVSEKQQNLQEVENSIDLNRNESREEEEIKKNTENQLNNSFFDFQQQQDEQIQQNQFQQGFKLSQDKTNNINNQKTQNSTNNIQTSKNSSTKKQIQGKSHQEQNLNSDKKSQQIPTSHNQNQHDFSSNVIFQNLVSPLENNNIIKNNNSNNVLTKKPSQEQKQQQQQQQQQEITENQEEEDYQDIFERENMHPLKTPQMTPQIKINHAAVNQFKQQDSPFLQFCMNQLSPLPSKPFYAQSPFAKIQDVQKGHENKKGNQLKIFASPSPMKGNKEGSYFGFMAEKILQKKIDFNEIPREQDACSKHQHHHNPTNQIEEELNQLEEFSDSQRIKNAKQQSQMSFGSQKALSQDGMNGSFNQFRHFPALAFPPRTMSFQGVSSQKATPVNPTRKPRELFSGLINKNNLSQQTGPNTNCSQDFAENSMSQTASFMGYDKPNTPALQQTQSQKDRSSFKKQNFKQSQGYENEESLDEDESKNFNSNLKMQRAISFGPGSTAKRQKIVCNCKKSRCLKLYCECFQAGQFCKDCNCTNCANIPENEEEKNQAMQQLKERNPNAFQPKVLQDEITSDAKQHQKGCNCKKSHCTKKYCECFQAGVPCTDLCKCEQCHNLGGGPCNHDDPTPYNSQILPGMHLNPQQYYPPHPYPYPSYPPDSALEQGRYPMPPPYYPYPNCTDKCCQHLLQTNPQQTQDDSALTVRRNQFPANMHQFQTSSTKKKIKEMPYYYEEFYHNYYPEYYHSQGYKEKFHMSQQMRYFPNAPYPPSYYNQFQGYMYGYPPHPIYMHPRRPSISSNEEENEVEQQENQQESQEQEQEQESSQNQDLTDQFNEYQQQHQQQQKQLQQQDNNLHPYSQFHQGNQVRQLNFLSGYKDHNKIAKQMKFDQEGSFQKSNQLKEQQTSLSAQKKIQQLLTPQKNHKNQPFKSQNQSIQKTPQQKQQFFSGKKPLQKQQKQKSQQSLQTDIEDDIEQEDSNQQSEQKMSSNSKQAQNSGSKIHHENNQIHQEEDISNDENEQNNILENNINVQQQQQQQKQINQMSAQKQQNPYFKTNNSSTTKKLNQVQQKLNFLNKKQQQQYQQQQQIQFQDQQIPYDLQQQLQNRHQQQQQQNIQQQNSLKKTPVADKKKSIINKHEETLEKKQKLVSLSKSKVTTPNPNKDMTSNKKLKTPNNQEIFQTPVTGRNLQQRFYSDEIASENNDDLPELDEDQEDSENIIHDINQNQNQSSKNNNKQTQKKTAKLQDQQLLQQQQKKQQQEEEEEQQQQNQQQDFEQEQQQQQQQNGKNKKKQKQQRKQNSNKLNCKQQMEEQEQEQILQEQIRQEKSQYKQQIEELPIQKQKLQDKKQPVKDNSTIKKRPPSKRIIQKKAKLQQI